MLPPEETITVFDRLACPYQRLIRKYRISDDVVLFLAMDNWVVLSCGFCWPFHGEDARLLAQLLLKVIIEDEPGRFAGHEFGWATSFDHTAYQVEPGAIDALVALGGRPRERYRFGNRKLLVVGEFPRGGTFRITEPSDAQAGDAGPRIMTLTPRVAELTTLTILAMIDDREPVFPNE